MKLETFVKNLKNIRLCPGVVSVEVDNSGKTVLMEGAAFYKRFPDHSITDYGMRYAHVDGVKCVTFERDPDSDEADTRQVQS